MSENFGVPQMSANNVELATEIINEAKKYEEYLRLQEEAPSTVRAEVEVRLGGRAIETVPAIELADVLTKMVEEYDEAARVADPITFNINRVKFDYLAKMYDLATTAKRLELLRQQFAGIPFPANDNNAEQNRVAA